LFRTDRPRGVVCPEYERERKLLRALFKIHFIAILANDGSLLGSLLLFLIGAYEVYEAFLLFFGFGHPSVPGGEITEATAKILSSLDSFLLGFVMLYFAYNLFFLLTFPEQRDDRFSPIKNATCSTF
jgi:hypothetical protein